MATRLCFSLLGACALLTACGQRGALYLPDEARNVVVRPAPAAAPAATPEASPTDAAATTDPTEEQRRTNAATPAK